MSFLDARSAIGPALLALAAGVAGVPAHAAAESAVATQLRQFAERLAQLEQRNQQLEQELRTLRDQAQPASPIQAPAATAIPGWGAARLTQLEQRVDALGRATDAGTEVPEEGGLTIEGGVVGVVQHVGPKGAENGQRQTRANWRGDLELSMPLGSVAVLGDAALSGFGHLRFGQGGGLGLRSTHTGTVNSVPFEAGAGSEETYAIVAQAWAQLTWPLDGDRFNDQPGSRVELTVGKMDLFGFFDQNEVAGDEGAQFLNNVFVHNPLLDSGGDIAADAYGLAPGARLAWVHEGENSRWGASLGVFGAGSAANFSAGGARPLVIGQLEWSPMQINGEPRGNYRLYAWTNGQTADLAGNAQRHSGWGLSLDQRVGREWKLFGRWGQRSAGQSAFDRALTLGFEHGGRAWGRGTDAVGLAVGWLRTDPALRVAGQFGQETNVEAYYRFKLNDHLELTPDLQWVRRAGGDPTAASFAVFGVRAAIGF
ncbi:MAG: carbohydrate porin [Burkholderiales bacterium]|nr:carbohydrate porin [Burkholderiales bacterium]